MGPDPIIGTIKLYIMKIVRKGGASLKKHK